MQEIYLGEKHDKCMHLSPPFFVVVELGGGDKS